MPVVVVLREVVFPKCITNAYILGELRCSSPNSKYSMSLRPCPSEYNNFYFILFVFWNIGGTWSPCQFPSSREMISWPGITLSTFGYPSTIIRQFRVISDHLNTTSQGMVESNGHNQMFYIAHFFVALLKGHTFH